MTPLAYALLGSLAAGLAAGLGAVPLVAVVDRINRAYQADLRDRMERAGMDTSALDGWLRGRVFGAVVVWLLAWLVLGMFPVGLMLGAFVYTLVPLVLERALLRQRSVIRDQLVAAVRSLASQVRGSVTLVRGLDTVAAQTPAPLGDLLRQTVARHKHGMADLPEVLGDLKDRLQMDTVSLFTIALATGIRKGGPIAQVLDGIGVSLEENQRVERKREADTAAGRLLVNLLVAFPFAFLGLFYMLDPVGVGSVFTTVLGQLIICVVGGMSYFALWLARKILGRAGG